MGVQIAVDSTRMDRHRKNIRVSARELRGEEDIRRLGGAIAMPGTRRQKGGRRGQLRKCYWADNMGGGCQREDTDIWSRISIASTDLVDGLLQRREQELRQQMMADMVGAQLHLKSFLGLGGRIAHGPGIENQEVQPVTLRVEFVCRGMDGFEGAQI